MTLVLKILAIAILIVAAVVLWTGVTTGNLGILERILVLGLGGLLVWGATRLQRRAA